MPRPPLTTDRAADPTACQAVRQHLHAHVDGELKAEEGQQALALLMQSHLLHCAPCSRVAAQLRAMREALRRHAEQSDEPMRDEFRARMHKLLAG
ncbi:anti-sigma factor family protein [Gemmatimonas sp. UBA7669]|jgi:anti-sigma factor RsiW|uniref:anti-sigma factor family protein n=1 Tax=Gemmatimonas sp. UBA7669 TaxID=1946568 RepID=UPI0025C2983D|nr:hypothetical protein [Gemmatimonas sp. UBA7669]